jgi:rhodanese-related sulfurtransferase
MTTATLSAAKKRTEFVADKLGFTIQPDEVNQLLQRDFNCIVVDVREAEDFVKGHVPGAINLPESNWRRISGWRDEWTMILYSHSQTCRLAVQAAVQFAMQGCSVVEMEGGFMAWKENKLPVET